MQIRRILSILPILMVCHIIPVTAETLVDGWLTAVLLTTTWEPRACIA